jgi:hypothetical protein
VVHIHRQKSKRHTTHIVFIIVTILILIAISTAIWRHTTSANPSGPITGLAGKCLANQESKKANANPIDLFKCNGSSAQVWTVEANTSLRVQGYCLGVQDTQVSLGASVRLYSCTASASQDWTINSSDELINPQTNLCLTVTGNNVANGSLVSLQTCLDSADQIWTLPKKVMHVSAPVKTMAAAPVTVSAIKPTIVGHELRLGSSGSRLTMHGVAVWGIEDQITTTFGVNEYNNRQAIINTIKAWGGNEIRLRVLASDYNNQSYMSQVQELQEIKNWQTTAQAAGIYVGITWWDSLDGTYSGANWANDYSQAFPMMSAVIRELGASNPWVFYEPFNEPHDVSNNQWLSAMESTDQLFRSDSYTGILLFDTNAWSHDYNDYEMTQLENYDASQAGMNTINQVIFAKHDYANEYPNYSTSFDSAYWANNDFGTSTWNFTKHLVWETEFGNYNGSSATISYPWSAGAASWMAAQVNNDTLVGATAFLFGPWYDANAMTTANGSTPTKWGSYVKNNFLEAAH